MGKKSDGLSGGGIVAIFICSIAVLAIVATIIYFVKRNKQNNLNNASENNSAIIPILFINDKTNLIYLFIFVEFILFD